MMGRPSEREELEENGYVLAKPQHPTRNLEMGVIAMYPWGLTTIIYFYLKIFQEHRKDPNSIFLSTCTLSLLF